MNCTEQKIWGTLDCIGICKASLWKSEKTFYPFLRYLFSILRKPYNPKSLESCGMISHRGRTEGTCVNSGVLSDWEITPKLSNVLTDWLYILGGFLSQLYVSAPLLAFFPHIDYRVFLSFPSWLQHWLPAMIPPVRGESWPISQYNTAGSRRNGVHFELHLYLVINLTLLKQIVICIKTSFNTLPVYKSFNL